MTQSDFSKNTHFQSIIDYAKSKDLGYQYVLEECKRLKWNINLKQSEDIANIFKVNHVLILFYADDINILNVDSKTKKNIQKQKKYKHEYINDFNSIQ